jgi:hypothetical protein
VDAEVHPEAIEEVVGLELGKEALVVPKLPPYGGYLLLGDGLYEFGALRARKKEPGDELEAEHTGTAIRRLFEPGRKVAQSAFGDDEATPRGAFCALLDDAFNEALSLEAFDYGVHLALTYMPNPSELALELAVKIVAVHAPVHKETEHDVFGAHIADVSVADVILFCVHGLQ